MKTLGRRLATVGVLVVTAATLPIIRPVPGPEIRHRSLPLAWERSLSIQSSGRAATWTSDPVNSPFAFGLVGVRWTGSLDGRIEIRTDAGGAWAPWEPVEPLDAAPDSTSPEEQGISSTEPVWVGEARRAQVRTIGAEPPSDLELQVVDPGPDPGPTPPAARAAPAQPGIISRAQWGADESIRKCCPRYASSVEVTFVHHTVTSNGYSPSESDDVVRSIYAYHVQTNGWDDIGYNFLVDRYGQIFEGRAGGIDRPVIGAHAQGFNTGSTGIAALGTFGSVDPPQATLNATANLIAWRMDIHHVDPAGQTQMTSGGSRKYPQGQVVTLNRVSGHRDTQETSCPGDRLYSRLGWLRTTSHDIGRPKIFDPSVSPRLFTPNGDGHADTARFTARTTGGNWTLRVLDEAGSERRRWQGSSTNVDVHWDGTQPGGASSHGNYRFRLDLASGSGGARPAEAPVSLFRHPWGPWAAVGGAIAAATRPETVTTPDGKVHALVRGSGGGLHHATWSGGSWGPWDRLGNLSDQAHPDSTLGFAAGHDGTLHAIVRGNDSRLYHGRISSSGAFSGWRRVGPSSSHGTDPALETAPDGSIRLVVVGGHDFLYDNVYRGGWRGWARVGRGHDNGTSPRLGVSSSGSVLLTVIGGDDGIYANLHGGDGWRGWSRVGRGHDRGRQPDLVSFGSGYVIAVRGMSGGLYSVTGTPGAWGRWSRVGNGHDDGHEPDLITAATGELVITVRGLSGTAYSNARRPGGGWTGWRPAGSTPMDGSVPASTIRGGNVFLIVQRGAGPPLATIGESPFAS